ncbi:HEAT repeat domain-containing protein [Bdellovibrio sp. HCB337]|uniref:HEAT repeat domain-containing protein n=1 Tax=Bdellovibrio sp. HCB337 TaxID=3394358 RepID=UPI0039A5C559
MKMNVLRALVLPWLLLFVLIIAAIVVDGVKFAFLNQYSQYAWYALWVGVVLCFYANFQTLSKAGIWIAHSLPSSLKKSQWGWLLRAVIVAGVGYGFFLAGQMTWAPVVWHAVVIPVIFAICLFVIIRSVMGPILVWCSRVAFSRFSAFMLSIPIFAMVPVTAMFLGNTILTAYKASRPDFVMVPSAPKAEEVPTAEAGDETSDVKHEIAAKSEVALELHDAAKSGKSCSDKNKLIQASLIHNGPDDVVYWAIQATKCAEMKSVVGLPKLAKIMTDHPNAVVRAASIRMMMKFSREDVKRIGYLIVKRISENEPLEVIEAASVVLPKLGEDEAKWTMKRLTGLLDSSKASGVASKVLVHNLKREDLVAEYVSTHLGENSPSNRRAISMICSLPKESRKIAEPHIESIVAAIKTGEANDPAIDALECLGDPGYVAIRQEVITPKRLEKPIAARALAEMDVKNQEPTANLETAITCARDQDSEVRKWCSQTLGKIGAPALPQILDLLKSGDKDLRDSGTNALNFFKDPVAKQELVKVRAENSGWMANQKKLQLAQAVDKALLKIMSEESQDPQNSQPQ